MYLKEHIFSHVSLCRPHRRTRSSLVHVASGSCCGATFWLGTSRWGTAHGKVLDQTQPSVLLQPRLVGRPAWWAPTRNTVGVPDHEVKWKSLSRVRLFVTPWIVASQASLSPWNFPSKNTVVGCHFLLQKIFPTQGSNLGLLHCRQSLYRLSHQRRLIKWELKMPTPQQCGTCFPSGGDWIPSWGA